MHGRDLANELLLDTIPLCMEATVTCHTGLVCVANLPMVTYHTPLVANGTQYFVYFATLQALKDQKYHIW